ncbi:hypothetical protein GGX14DRAFT_387741 [Mycena pura]|uniref:Uncharacterized protein n=1 Tax=Mycena pura TaxID=153505 RepID=A0AAD6YM76_9AGAR|nr:hypothetical protein GGX14DRAFT_387741 [Mycena pura]
MPVSKYWSLDPTGTERSRAEDTKDLWIPGKIKVWGQSWDGSAYDGLRKFHRGKGFNPDSQDIARHLGYPPKPECLPRFLLDFHLFTLILTLSAFWFYDNIFV